MVESISGVISSPTTVSAVNVNRTESDLGENPKYQKLLFKSMDTDNDGKVSDEEKNNFDIEKFNAEYGSLIKDKYKNNNDKKESASTNKGFWRSFKIGATAGLAIGGLFGGITFGLATAAGFSVLAAAGLALPIIAYLALSGGILNGCMGAMLAQNNEEKSETQSNDTTSKNQYTCTEIQKEIKKEEANVFLQKLDLDLCKMVKKEAIKDEDNQEAKIQEEASEKDDIKAEKINHG